jgi:hypothetical protein
MKKTRNIRIITDQTIEYLANRKRKFWRFAFNCNGIIPTFIYVAVISSLGMPVSIWEAPLVLILDYCF